MAGKSLLIKKIIESRDEVYDVEFSRIIYCLPSEGVSLHHQYLESLKAVCPFLEVQEGIPDLQGENVP